MVRLRIPQFFWLKVEPCARNGRLWSCCVGGDERTQGNQEKQGDNPLIGVLPRVQCVTSDAEESKIRRRMRLAETKRARDPRKWQSRQHRILIC